MLFRQFIDSKSSTLTYLLASERGKALLIDPVLEQTDMYLSVIKQLNLSLAYALDTHTHADHITALGALREHTQCITVMGSHSEADCVSYKVADGEVITMDELSITAWFTPGHTDESYSYLVNDCVFTGDVLLYRSTGRTDFQSGDPCKSWNSIVNRLFQLPDNTRVYAGHDYKGWTMSTIGEEKQFNPRLAGKTQDEYVQIMNHLNLPNPKMMDIAIPANLACGQGGIHG